MDSEITKKIFEPFFTTKFTGRGLGLAAVFGIVRSHEGAIAVESARGHGTRFRVYFPVIEPIPRQSRRASVVFADQEEGVRLMAKATLERAGFNVTLARDEHEAIKALEQNPHAFELAVIDLPRADAGAFEALRNLRRVRPDLKLVVSTGEQTGDTALENQPVDALVSKPYSPSMLVKRVRELLSQGAE